MVSSDEIRKRLEDKRKGKTDDLFCPECGTKNPYDSQFCLECGGTLKSGAEKKVPRSVPPVEKSNFADDHPTLAKIPGFRSGTKWKMIVGSVGYFLITIIVIFTLLFAIINTDIAISVNTAIFTDNVAGNTVNGISIFNDNESKFLLMNVSVKNKGNNKVTVNPSDFSILTNNEDDKSQIFIGNTTISSIELGPGENKTMLIAFTLESNAKPEKLRYVSFWDPSLEGATANIGNVANTTPFDGQYSFYIEKGEYKWSGGSKSSETTTNVSYNFLNQPFTTQSLDLSTFNISNSDLPSINTSTTYNQSIKQTVEVKHISPSESSIYLTDTIYITRNSGITTDILSPYLRDKKGTFWGIALINPRLDSVGENTTVVDSSDNEIGYHKLIRSEIIEIMGKKFDCWVVEEKINSTGKDENSTYYYDKTTGLLLKVVIKEVMSGYGQTANYTGEMVLSASNVPLVGLNT